MAGSAPCGSNALGVRIRTHLWASWHRLRRCDRSRGLDFGNTDHPDRGLGYVNARLYSPFHSIAERPWSACQASPCSGMDWLGRNGLHTVSRRTCNELLTERNPLCREEGKAGSRGNKSAYKSIHADWKQDQNASVHSLVPHKRKLFCLKAGRRFGRTSEGSTRGSRVTFCRRAGVGSPRKPAYKIINALVDGKICPIS